MTSRQALFTFLPFKSFFTFKTIRMSPGTSSVPSTFNVWVAGRNYNAFAALERNLVTLVVGDLSLTLQANQNHEAVQLGIVQRHRLIEIINGCGEVEGTVPCLHPGSSAEYSAGDSLAARYSRCTRQPPWCGAGDSCRPCPCA